MPTLKSYLLPALIGVGIGAALIAGQQWWESQAPKEPSSNSAPQVKSEWNGPYSYAKAVEAAAPAVVNIYTLTHRQTSEHPLAKDPLFRHFFNNSDSDLRQRIRSALGSGVVISPNGFILTNHHVIDGADEIVVLLNDGREAKAEKVGSDPESDLAVLKIGFNNLTPIDVGNSNEVAVGDVVLAIGNPFGVGQTVTQGIISATGRYGLGINTYENYIQTDAAINPGNSGGALIDAKGRLVGINTAILDKTGFSVGIGFAIPSMSALQAMNDIVRYGKVLRGWLGIEARQMSPQLAKSLGLDTAGSIIISGIYPNSPAEMAGLKPGDIILSINQLKVSDGRISMYQVAQGRPGEEIDIEALRDGKIVIAKATLGLKPGS